jgi:PAS domain S-box-containing protein
VKATQASLPRESNSPRWLHKLARISPVGIYHCDTTGRCLYVNERWCELTGLAPEQAMGAGWERAIHPDDRARVHREWMQTAKRREPFRSEYRYRRPDGSVVWIFGEVVEDRDARGQLAGLIGTVTDITELRHAREALQRSQDELEQRVRDRTRQLREVAMVVEQSEDAIIRSSLESKIVGWNRGAERLFGYGADEMIGETTAKLTPPEFLEEALAIKRDVRRGRSVQNLEVMRLHKDGRLLAVSLSVFPLRDDDGTIIGTSAMVRDLSEQKRAEQRLRLLSQRLLRAQDEERRRIARELHDSTAQLLAALSINLGQVLKEVERLSATDCTRMLAESAILAERATMELRTQAYLLHPPLLEERGLVAALRVFIDGFTQRSGVRVKFQAPARLVRLEESVELVLFRVVQEALTNVHRHAGSSRATIQLTAGRNAIKLSIRDYGRGLSAETRELPGVGLAGMRERVSELGGTLSVTSTQPGVCIEARLPRHLPR